MGMARPLLLCLFLAVTGQCLSRPPSRWRPDFRIRDPLQLGGEIVAIFSSQSALKAYLTAQAEDFPGWASPVTAAPLIEGGGQELLLATAVVSAAWLLAGLPPASGFNIYAQRMPSEPSQLFDVTNAQLVNACNISLAVLLLMALPQHQPVDVWAAGVRVATAYPFLLFWRVLYSSSIPPTLV
ncbi:hypothetical protein B484DRAFT_401833 [Ochromonadaceae sp. CCMP2298]|nr:hypothetical protein B484DRAFT_401833 [Ochromonadaceae sp. CCMP2298]|mmetsp:Transcript_27938/g.61853  ORF Transcript_27938/g.61853 Transcript_27938/m.61853 type:complete len:183 (-) Transcript_27938:413-961(-)